MKLWQQPWQDSEGTLNLTACIDVFAVLTLYLLMGLTQPAAAQRLRLPADIFLPHSTTEMVPGQGVSISLSRTAIRVNNQWVVAIDDGAIDDDARNQDTTTNPLLRALLRAKRQRIAASNEPVSAQALAFNDILTIEATHGLPYGLVQRVIDIAAIAGFGSLQLAVSHKGIVP